MLLESLTIPLNVNVTTYNSCNPGYLAWGYSQQLAAHMHTFDDKVISEGGIIRYPTKCSMHELLFVRYTTSV